MYKLKSLLLITLLIWFYSIHLKAQQSSNSSGSKPKDNSEVVTYALGQVLFETSKGSNKNIHPGIKIPYDFSILSGVEMAKDIKLVYKLLPNLSTSYLILKSQKKENRTLKYMLYSLEGKLLITQKIDEDQTKIDLSALKSSIYLLKVHDQTNTSIKTFKIHRN